MSADLTQDAHHSCMLRPFRPGDEGALVRHANNKAVWMNLRDQFPHPYTLEDASKWITHCMRGHHDEINRAITVDDEVVGAIGLMRQEDIQRFTAEIGYWLGEEVWGRGYATEAVRAMTAYAFDELDFIRIQARVFEINTASRRVLEKAGFVLEGRLRKSAVKEGRVLDQFLYARVQ